MRVIGQDGQQIGIISLGEALNMARAQGVDLVEIAAAANPPVCRLVDFGKYRYEQSKKDKEVKKHHHANKVKEIQLSPSIDPHDFGVKLTHAVDFLCEEMKVKVTLKFRGREMAHKEYGFQVVEKFLKSVAPYGHPDAPAKLIGKGINVMLSPLPRNKRAKNPKQVEEEQASTAPKENAEAPSQEQQEAASRQPKPERIAVNAAEQPSSFGQNPFAGLDIASGQ